MTDNKSKGPESLLPPGYNQPDMKPGMSDFEGTVPDRDKNNVVIGVRALFREYAQVDGAVVGTPKLLTQDEVEARLRREKLNPTADVREFNTRQLKQAVDRLESYDVIQHLIESTQQAGAGAGKPAASLSSTHRTAQATGEAVGARRFGAVYEIADQEGVRGTKEAVFSLAHRKANGEIGHMNVSMDQDDMNTFLQGLTSKADKGGLSAVDRGNYNNVVAGMKDLGESIRTNRNDPSIMRTELQDVQIGSPRVPVPNLANAPAAPAAVP